MVLFLAGLAAIPQQSLRRGLKWDGGGSRAGSGSGRVTWPLMLGRTTLFVTVITATGAFRVFEERSPTPDARRARPLPPTCWVLSDLPG